MRRAVLWVTGLVAAIFVVAAAPPKRWDWDMPATVAPPPVPADNPMTAAKVELGRRLFYEADLSINGTMSCASCHEQKHGFADGNVTHPGVHGDPGRRNVPGLANIGYFPRLTAADPRQTTLEMQVAVPVFGQHPVEMGMAGQEEEIVRRLGQDRCYARMFKAAFPESHGVIAMADIAKALASFQRTLNAFDTPFDRYQRGQAASIPVPARRGAALFQGRAGCAACHSGANFTDYDYHALSLSSSRRDPGLEEATGEAKDAGRFRTPGLRNVALTAPYMHDGTAPTLDEALRRHSSVWPRTANLTDQDRGDLLVFLGTLTDPHFIADKRLALPAMACGKKL